MGKGLATRDQPGASAAAEGRRARRSASRRRLGSAALALIAATGIAGGLAASRPVLTVGGIAVGALSWWWRPAPDPDRWLRGADAELATAQLLSQLPRRFIVLHDRHQPGRRGNLDHVVIGPSGVWVVDSKSRHARLRVRRGQVWAGRHPIDVAPAATQAAQVEEALGVPVAAVVAVHGSGLRRRGKKVTGVRVVPASRVPRRLRRGRRLSRPEVAHLAAQVDRMFPPC